VFSGITLFLYIQGSSYLVLLVIYSLVTVCLYIVILKSLIVQYTKQKYLKAER